MKRTTPMVGWLRWVRLPGLSAFHQNFVVTVVSALICVMLMPMALPGTLLAGVSVNWMLIWVVSWSLKRSPLLGLVAGVTVGLLMDGLASAHPSHVLAFGTVGLLTGIIQKQRYVQEDFISVALMVFAMALVAETITATQLSLMAMDWRFGFWGAEKIDPNRALSAREELAILNQLAQSQKKVMGLDHTGYTVSLIWVEHQRIALSSAIVSSLWAPLIAWPLNRWWDYIRPKIEI